MYYKEFFPPKYDMEFTSWLERVEKVTWSRGTPGAGPHANADIQQAIVKLQTTGQELKNLIDMVLRSDHFKQHPQFQQPFLTRMREGVDAVNRAHAILVADPNWKENH